MSSTVSIICETLWLILAILWTGWRQKGQDMWPHAVILRRHSSQRLWPHDVRTTSVSFAIQILHSVDMCVLLESESASQSLFWYLDSKSTTSILKRVLESRVTSSSEASSRGMARLKMSRKKPPVAERLFLNTWTSAAHLPLWWSCINKVFPLQRNRTWFPASQQPWLHGSRRIDPPRWRRRLRTICSIKAPSSNDVNSNESPKKFGQCQLPSMASMVKG